jgi:hypothetical protein
MAALAPSNCSGGQFSYYTYNNDGSLEATYQNNNGVPGDPTVILTSSFAGAQLYGMHWLEVYQPDIIYASNVVAAGKIKR